MVTLTNLANDNLPFALGRGCLGQARGRLLVLAEESGIAAKCTLDGTSAF